MTVNRTTLLDLPLPVTGTESGTWGDTTNNGLTQYMDIAIAGMSNLTSANFTTGALTIETTEGNSSGTNITATSGQYAGFRVTSLAQNSTITVGNTGTNPARSYRLINADATYTLTFKATGQTGITLQPGQTAVVAFNGTDYVIVGMAGAGTVTDNAVVRFDGTTGKLVQNSVVTIADTTGDVAGVGALTASGNLTLSGGTANGVLYLNGSKVATSGSAVTYNGTTFATSADASISGLTVGKGAGAVSTNTAVGASALNANTSGNFNTANGHQSLLSNTTGALNTAMGAVALQQNTTGSENVAVGQNSLPNNTTGSFNTAVGRAALVGNTTASYNTAVGYQAGFSNTTGQPNNAFGAQALYTNTTGAQNSAFGASTLYANTTGSNNAAFGNGALQANTTASNNTAVGYQSLYTNATGARSTAIGHSALYSSTVSDNTGVGYFAGYSINSGQYNLAVGGGDGATGATLSNNTTGSYNTALGFQALKSNTTSSYNTAVGYQAGYSNTTVGGAITAVGYKAGYATAGGSVDAFGYSALAANTTGANNVSFGFASMLTNLTGSNNTAMGVSALQSNTTASNNTAVGYQALYANTTGANNTAVGYQALDSTTTGKDNTALGIYAGQSQTTATSNCFVGTAAGSATTGSFNTFIGSGEIGVSAGAGEFVTTGSKNTIIGRYSGNQGGLDIRTASNYIVLSDGDGNPRAYWDGSGNMLNTAGSIGPVSAPSTAWGVDFAPSTSASTYVTLANNATYDLASGSGFVYLWAETAAAGVSQIACYYGAVSIIWQNGSLYTVVSGTANSINVYYNAGTGKYRIENKYGSSFSLWVSTFRMRNGS